MKNSCYLMFLIAASVHCRVASDVNDDTLTKSEFDGNMIIKQPNNAENNVRHEEYHKGMNETVNIQTVDKKASQVRTISINISEVRRLLNTSNLNSITNEGESQKLIQSIVKGYRHQVKKEQDENLCNDACGTELLLTPYIEKRLFSEARAASAVNRSVFLGFESYSGFLTVDKRYNSNTFFWYFPSLAVSNEVHETPCIIWLQGGPGVTSLQGLLQENGPFTTGHDSSLRPNPETWLHDHSLIFIDNPVGTGFSFTEHEYGYVRDMDTYSRHLYTAFEQLLQLYPELRDAPLYVAGESYAGKYAPALAAQIHDHIVSGDIIANLQGVIIGNGFVESQVLYDIVRPLYNFGIVSREQADELQLTMDDYKALDKENKSAEAKSTWKFMVSQLQSMTAVFTYNFMKDSQDFLNNWLATQNFMKDVDVRKALHVGSRSFNLLNITVNQELDSEFTTSARHLYEKLLENNYRVLAYCGQLDLVIPCVLESENLRTWRWHGANSFLEAPRHVVCPNKRSGYWKSGGNLTEVVVHSAGHMAAHDAAAATRAFVTAFTSHSAPDCSTKTFTTTQNRPLSGNVL